MAVDLSIRNVPDTLLTRLRERAARQNRSLEGELLAILEDAVAESTRLTPGQVLARVKALGLQTPRESATMLREDRDAR
jgi:antitoxin FitA